MELAICLPLIVLLALGSIEMCGKIFLQETLYVAAYEGALTAARINGTTTTAQDRIETILDARLVQGYAVSFEPANVETVAPGERITVTVTAPVASNSLLPSQFFPTTNLTAALHFVKEERP